MIPDPGAFSGIIVAILGGAAVGVERQHSGHASGPDARLGGIRTFTLLGAVAGISGFLLASSMPLPAALLLGGGIGIVVTGYVRASRGDIDATTEVAAIVVLGAGVIAGLDYLRLSAALTTLTVLLLAEKPRLHGFVARLDDRTLLAAARFAVMSAVVLPLLPIGPYGPPPGIKPRDLWLLVLLFSAISFSGYIAQRASGSSGYALTGLLGGLVSSTSVTLSFARLSRTHREQAQALSAGAIAASAVLFARVLVVVAVLDAALVPILVRYLWAPMAVAVVTLAIASVRARATSSDAPTLKNPLNVLAAIEMALLFQAVLFAVFYVRQWIGNTGVLVSGFLLGLTDVDALTLSMTRSVSTGTVADVACRAIVMGIIANSILKAAIALGMGRDGFRWRAGISLAAIAVAAAIALAV